MDLSNQGSTDKLSIQREKITCTSTIYIITYMVSYRWIPQSKFLLSWKPQICNWQKMIQDKEHLPLRSTSTLLF